jgi:hypothetical protein
MSRPLKKGRTFDLMRRVETPLTPQVRLGSDCSLLAGRRTDAEKAAW